MLPNTEIIPIFLAKALTVGAMSSFSDGFPLGPAYTRFILRLKIVLTNTTGTTAISEGELNLLKSLNLKTSRGEMIFNGVPGRALWRIDQAKTKTLNAKDAISATAGTFYVQFNLWFADPLCADDDYLDTVLDTSRYDSLKLDLQIGTVADLLSSVGDSSIVVTADLFGERIKGILDEASKPKDHVEYFCPAAVNPSNSTEMQLEKAPDIAYKRIYAQFANSVSAGVAFSGTPANTTISDISLDSSDGKHFETIPTLILNAINKSDYQLETAVIGMNILDLVDGRNMASLYAGDKSRLRLQWTNGSLSTSQVSAVTEAIRPLK